MLNAWLIWKLLSEKKVRLKILNVVVGSPYDTAYCNRKTFSRKRRGFATILKSKNYNYILKTVFSYVTAVCVIVRSFSFNVS